jgi:hypothetical protein
MHIFVNMSTQVDKCLQVFEENVYNGGDIKSNTFQKFIGISPIIQETFDIAKMVISGTGSIEQMVEPMSSKCNEFGFCIPLLVGNVLDLTPHLVALQVKLKELASDASPLLGGETIIFVEIDLHKDEIFH